MAVASGGEPRISRALGLLRGDRFSRLRRAMRVELLAFAGDAEPVSLDTVAATRGEATDISRALSAAVEGRTGQDEVSAVLLLSDGAHNSGADPVAVAEELGVPVYAVAVGAESERPRDIQVLSAEASAAAFVGQPFPVRVEVRGWGVGRTRDPEIERERPGAGRRRGRRPARGAAGLLRAEPCPPGGRPPALRGLPAGACRGNSRAPTTACCCR